MSLGSSMVNIGRDLVPCRHNGDESIADPANGILPHFLIPETEGRGCSIGAVGFGMNPGRSSAEERGSCLARGPACESTVGCRRNEGAQWRYHARI
jgi:hypothetical protein